MSELISPNIQTTFFTVQMTDGYHIRLSNSTLDHPHLHAHLKGRVLLLTGFTEFIEKYDEVISEFVTQGWEVVCFDWRGQGLSDRFHDDPHRGYGIDFDQQLDDLNVIYTQFFADYQGEKRVVAHSMGGHMALRYIAHHPGHFQQAYCLAPMIALPMPVRLIKWVSRLHILLGLGERYAWGQGVTDDAVETKVTELFEKLCHDRARFDTWFTLALSRPEFRMYGPTWQWLNAASHSLERLWLEVERIETNTVIFSATDEKIVNAKPTPSFVERNHCLTLVTVENSRHEILFENDTIRANFWRVFDDG